MNRRDFLKAAGLGIAATTLAACADSAPVEQPASAGAGNLPVLDWQMATSWTPALDILFGATQKFAERVAALTDGKFKITPRAGGELAKATEVLDVVSSGAVPIGHTASYYYIGKSWVMAFGTCLPFGFTVNQQNAWLYQGGGLKLLQDFYAKKFNVVQFPAGNTGVQMGGWFRKEINTLADLQGLKMRIPGLGGQVMSALGVQVQNLPGGEIFQALETGAIDAAEWVGPYDDEKLGLYKATGFYYAPSWWEPGSTLELQINLDEWNKLPAQYQSAVIAAAGESNVMMTAHYEAVNGEALERLVAGGVELRTYSDEIMQAAKEKAFELYEAKSAEDAEFQAVYKNWNQFRERVQKWDFSNEFNYLKFLQANK
jgi:TRAP-type mannitol/chloroaromatic compound transport system substrate-binding protein